MQINFVRLFIVLLLALLFAYSFFVFHLGLNLNKQLLGIGGFVFLVATLVPAFSLKYNLPRTGANIRTVSGIFFAIALMSNFLFTFITFSATVYILINGIFLLVYLLIVSFIASTKQ